MTGAEADREIVTTRRLAASRDRVWRAWTDPSLLAQWWGPKGFRNTFHAFDPRPGGEWRFVMHGPDGTDYPMRSVFVEVTPPSRLVFDHFAPTPTHHYRATAVFSDESGGTRVAWTMRFADEAEHRKVKDFIARANEENLDRLESVLMTTT